MSKTETLGLIPLHNFGVVSHKHKIYRCAQPLNSREYIWLKEMLGIVTIVNLRAESHHDAMWAPKYDINVMEIPVKDHDVPTKEQADDFIAFIRKNAMHEAKGQHPVLIHCEHGHGRTSTFCVLAKLALGSTLKQALKEESNKFHYTFNHYVQTQFLADYYAEMDRKTYGVEV